MKKAIDFQSLTRHIRDCPLPVSRGRVLAVIELTIEAEVVGARVGLGVTVESPGRPRVPAEVAACDGLRVTLIPLGNTLGIGPGDPVTIDPNKTDSIPCGFDLLGRIIDPLARPLDGRELPLLPQWSLNREPPNPLSRNPINQQLVTGIRSLDACLSLGVGQRFGIFAGPGLGKSTLLADLAKCAEIDISVICLVGERGREVREFLDNKLGKGGLARSVVVLATADTPPVIRLRALKAATAISEWFRGHGKRVLLLVDSLTRILRAGRDMALALGEPQARGGFPASVFASLPSLLERTGHDEKGSITAGYAVLTEGYSEDPIAEEARSLLDGHIVLSTKLAKKAQWPAIDILNSISRVMESVASKTHLANTRRLRRMIAALETNDDLIKMGAYQRGSCPVTDLAISRSKEISDFLTQGRQPCSIDDTLNQLTSIVRQSRRKTR